MSETTEKTRVRTAIFGRSYDHKAGSVTFEVAGHPDAKTTADVAGLPEATRNSLALIALADYAATRGNKAKREGSDVAKATDVLRQAIEDAKAGKIEFTDGNGLGMASAPMTALVGRALVEMGKTFVAFNGKRTEFGSDVDKAAAALKALYDDTTEVEITTKDGSKKKLSGRMFYNQIANLSDVEAKVATYRKAKPEVSVEGDMLG